MKKKTVRPKWSKNKEKRLRMEEIKEVYLEGFTHGFNACGHLVEWMENDDD